MVLLFKTRRHKEPFRMGPRAAICARIFAAFWLSWLGTDMGQSPFEWLCSYYRTTTAENARFFSPPTFMSCTHSLLELRWRLTSRRILVSYIEQKVGRARTARCRTSCRSHSFQMVLSKFAIHGFMLIIPGFFIALCLAIWALIYERRQRPQHSLKAGLIASDKR